MLPAKDTFYKEKIVKLSLGNENVTSVEFEEVKFLECNFFETRFTDCKFINCKFENSTLSACYLTDSLLLDTSFINSKAIGIDWTKASRLENLSFINSQINFSNFRMLKLQKIVIERCEAKDTDFTETNLSEANLQGTDFENAIFSKTNLVKADLRGAKNYFIDVRSNLVKKAKFTLPDALSLLQGLDIVLE